LGIVRGTLLVRLYQKARGMVVRVQLKSSLIINEQCKSVAYCDLEQNTLSSAARLCMDILVVVLLPLLARQMLKKGNKNLPP